MKNSSKKSNGVKTFISLFKNNLGKKRLSILVFSSLFAVVGISALYVTSAAPKNRTSGVNLSMQANSTRLKTSDDLVITITADAQSQVVNAVQANIEFSSEDFEFVGIDYKMSDFAIEAESSGGQGIIKIARGSITNLTGKLNVAEVTLRPVQSSRKSFVTFSGGTALISSSTFQNILENTYDLKVSIR